MYHLTITGCSELAEIVEHQWVNGNRNLVRCIFFQLTNPQLMVVLKHLEDYHQLKTTKMITEPVIDCLNGIDNSVCNSPDWENARCIIEEASGL